ARERLQALRVRGARRPRARRDRMGAPRPRAHRPARGMSVGETPDGPVRDPRGTAATDRLNYTAYRLARALNRAAENTALAHGLTLAQLLILQVLGEGLPLSNAQVARRTFVSSQAAHVVSAELLDAGLIEKVEHPTNRRVRLVRLSEDGWRVLGECDAEIREREAELDERIG